MLTSKHPPGVSFFFLPTSLSFYLSLSFFLSLHTIKGSSNQSGPTDPSCQPADPVYSSVSRTTSCKTIVYPSRVHMSPSKAVRRTHTGIIMLNITRLLTMTFSSSWCVCVCVCVCVDRWSRGLLLNVSVSSDVNIESTSSQPVLTSV